MTFSPIGLSFASQIRNRILKTAGSTPKNISSVAPEISPAQSAKARSISRYFGWLGAAIVLLTLLAYLPLLKCGFINYDDPLYVIDNRMVKLGLTSEGVRWAFSTTYGGNWHPLTWLSHMLDCQLFGLKPLGHHVTNLLFHLGNTLLLFALFRRMTGTLWRSAFVAALFALHPLHVESVAWISERKDVLSTFFGLLSTWFYLRYVETKQTSEARTFLNFQPSTLNYSIALLFFAFSLMSKAMLVTLPFLWLLLDFWPLNRLKFSPFAIRNSKSIFLEKIPFLLFCIVISVVTYTAQTKAMLANSGDTFSWLFKLIVVVKAYVAYIGKLVYPAKLAVIYPLPPQYQLWQNGILALALVLVCLLAFRFARQRPWIAVGWFWFLGTLVPVVGFVKVGLHSIADRYTYVPSIGFFILIAWGAHEIVQRYRFHKIVSGIVFGLALGSSAALTCIQVGHWQSSKTLFAHALSVTQNNAVAHDNFGLALLVEKNLDEAKSHFNEVIRLAPRSQFGHNHLGGIYLREGKIDEALAEFRQAVQCDPDHATGYGNLAEALLEKKEFDEALACSLKAIHLNPDFATAYYNAGTVYLLQNDTEKALAYFGRALELKSDFPEAHNNYGFILAKKEKLAEAEQHYLLSLRFKPNNPDAEYNLGNLYLREKKYDQAEKHYVAVIQHDAGHAQSYYQLGVIYSLQRKYSLAVQSWREAIRRKPSWPEPLNNLSWLLATTPDDSVRDGREALKLARVLETFTGDDHPATLDTIAAASAECGQFDEAIDYQRRAITLAEKKSAEFAQPFKARLQLYQARKPYRE